MPKPRQLKKGGDFTITATFDASSLTAALERLQRVSKKDMNKLVKESGRRLGIDLAIRTFPKLEKQGVGTISSDASKIYPTRRRIKQHLEKHKPDAGKIFFSIFKRNPKSAIAYAQKIGFPIDLVSRPDKKLIERSVTFTGARSGGRSSRIVKNDGPLQMLRDPKAIEPFVKRIGRRVGTVAGGWVEASKSFGAIRYDGNDANLAKFKRARRPMIVGRGNLTQSGATSTAVLTNLVEYSDKCIPSEAVAYAIRREVVNLGKRADVILNKTAQKEMAKA